MNPAPETPVIETSCCIAGGGPAGMMLGLLLARAGLDVVVLEKHADFLRDFRGDTIHPSTLQVLRELGLFESFRPLLQNEMTTLDVVLSGRRVTPVDFSKLRGPCNFLGMAPQWEFLDFLAGQAQRYPGFRLLMRTEVTDLITDDLITEHARVTGVLAKGPSGPVEIRSPLVVAADGRSSTIRDLAKLKVRETGMPIDVLWFRLAKLDPEPPPTLAYIGPGGMVLTIDRGAYYQAGMYVEKGSFTRIQQTGIGELRGRIVAIAPPLSGVVDALTEWEQVKLLSVQVNHLKRWHRPGLLCIGDASHAMSPAFGVGVNYAVQDAVAAARILAPRLRRGNVTDDDLAAVQARRNRPTRVMQQAQVLLHRRIGRPDPGRVIPMLAGRLAPIAAPVLQPLAAQIIGQGLRQEHVLD